MQFSRLKLSGFKSFIEPAELNLSPGLTGVVGPNGCGKSNLVEALRWVMGENSPRKMRGGEMDDVIFNGTATRPARNVAEVSLLLDNATRDAPAAHNETAEIEIQRRIERQGGSIYRINGREARARDVQLLFADASSGAKSAALVGQGRVGELINAKPEQRRHLLEEAAGIAGLQSRRHEAELRLRAADANLARLADVMDQLQAQLDSLKRQARQAGRYRRLSERIRETEARLLERRWQAAEAAVVGARGAMAEADAVVVARTEAAATAATALAAAAADLPPARTAEAEAGAELHRLEVARVALDAEEERLMQQKRELEQQLARTTTDMERERALASDAEAAFARLDAELADLRHSQDGEEEGLATAATARAAAAAVVTELEARVSALAAERASREARRDTLRRDLEALTAQRSEIERRLADIRREIAEVAGRAIAPARHEFLIRAEAEADQAVEAMRTAAVAAATRRSDAESAEAVARGLAQTAEARLARTAAEAAALAELLDRPGARGTSPVLDAVTVDPGYELALGAALGEDLDAPADIEGPALWRTYPPLDPPPPLPQGSTPLAALVRGPEALARRLSQVGVVNQGDGDRLAVMLAPGQRLVSREGGLWRWDGFTVQAGAMTSAATRLRQRNRLADLKIEIAPRAANFETLGAALAAAQGEHRVAVAADGDARERLRQAHEHQSAARAERTAIEAEIQALAMRQAGLEERLAHLVSEDSAVTARLADVAAALAALPAPEAGDAELVAMRRNLDIGRQTLAERMGAHEIMQQSARNRRERLAAAANEQAAWRNRATGAANRLAELAERKARTEAERAALAERPAEIAGQRARLLDSLGAAEARRSQASDARALAEERQALADRGARSADRSLGEAREERVRREAALEQSETQRQDLAVTIAERLNVEPDQLGDLIAAGPAEDPEAAEASVAELAAGLQRMQRERDGIGPVNLRAEIEAQEVEQQHGVMASERADLEAAIARLRRGIGELNREGRDRLIAAFNVIDGHFRSLFSRLFGGGEAHLALIDAEDPLEAGLEINASPPGKKLQTLSLLSGGEQALTALALIFAQFLTNPSPVCVLDEVDAPLDDANVERFCNLLAEMVKSGSTRFLVITHHPMTMARMDRLFGVTMSERGVSQLVSVDLATAEGLRATA
ncbi:MAG: hypothetical protein EXQ94_07290 [Alphaproteobacteria bacterium]|nr:hypothetical protein [Alphaproteobacteria bacterium]